MPRREDQLMPNGSEYRRTEANTYSIECRTGGKAGGHSCLGGREAIRQKGRFGGRTVGRDLLGVVQKNEKEDEMLAIQKREGSGGSNSQRPIEMKAVAIERTAKDLRMTHKRDRTGPRCDE
jgi:hypothetical protein